jgi:hypothetical protein
MDCGCYERLPLGSRVTVPAGDVHLKRLLERLGFAIERADEKWFVMRRDTGPLLPVLQLVREGHATRRDTAKSTLSVLLVSG